MKRAFVMTIIILLIFTGCKKEVTQDNPQKAVEETIINVEEDIENDVIKEFYIMVRDKKSSDELMVFLDETFERVQNKEKQNSMIDTLFKQYREETFNILLKDSRNWMKYSEKYIGKLDFNNQQDIDKIEDTDSEFKVIVQKSHDKGYKFLWWGGNLHIHPDYKILLDKYSSYMRESLQTYISTYADIIYDPIFKIKGCTYNCEIPKDMIELLVSSDEVTERMLRLENVFRKYPDSIRLFWDMEILYHMHVSVFLIEFPIIIEDENELIEIYSSYKVEYPDTNLAPYMDEYIQLIKSDSFKKYKKACENNVDPEGQWEFRDKVREIIREIKQKYN